MTELSRDLPQDVVELLEDGAPAGWLATCDRDGLATGAPVMGVRVTPRGVVLYVPELAAGATFDNLRFNPKVAVFFCQITTYRAVQLKGTLLDVTPTDAEGRAIQQRYIAMYGAANAAVGSNPTFVRRLRFEPSMAVTMCVLEAFVQTPGPQAGTSFR